MERNCGAEPTNTRVKAMLGRGTSHHEGLEREQAWSFQRDTGKSLRLEEWWEKDMGVMVESWAAGSGQTVHSQDRL